MIRANRPRPAVRRRCGRAGRRCPGCAPRDPGQDDARPAHDDVLRRDRAVDHAGAVDGRQGRPHLAKDLDGAPRGATLVQALPLNQLGHQDGAAVGSLQNRAPGRRWGG